ncbi:MAG: hypothetical protein ACRD1C_09845 [Terriglobales bacterium]
MKKTMLRFVLPGLIGVSLVAASVTFAAASANAPLGCSQACSYDSNNPCNGQYCNNCTWESYMNYKCQPVY